MTFATVRRWCSPLTAGGRADEVFNNRQTREVPGLVAMFGMQDITKVQKPNCHAHTSIAT